MSAWSVSQRLLPDLSEGITWCLSGSTQYLSCLCLSDGLDLCLSELVPAVSFLPMSVWRNLLMSIWTELACFLASIYLVSSIGVCLKCFPLLFCQYLSNGITWCLSGFFWKAHLVSVWTGNQGLWIKPYVSLLSLSVCGFNLFWGYHLDVFPGAFPRFCI